MIDIYSELHRSVPPLRSPAFADVLFPIRTDRNNVPAARSNGLEEDLNLTGNQYPSLLSLLYVGYILFQVRYPVQARFS